MASSSSNNDNFTRPRVVGGIFKNPAEFTSWVDPPSLTNSLGSLMRWLFTEKAEKMPTDEAELNRHLPVAVPEFPTNSDLGVTWLGHATLFVRIDGLSLLTDPVWARHASPFRWGCPRYRPPPCTVDELPQVDLVVLSHNHYDHLDSGAVRKLALRFPHIRWFVPSGLAEWLRKEIGRTATVHELSWGEHVELPAEQGRGVFRVNCVPAQHWSQRTMFDRNRSLWSGWLLQGPRHRFLYTGDTGFCESEFRKIGERFGPVDLCAIPIGCYSPRWFMRPQHIDPAEAVQIHRLVRSKKSIGVHWGTYAMGSTEQFMEPAGKLEEEARSAGLEPDEFCTIGHGASWHI